MRTLCILIFAFALSLNACSGVHARGATTALLCNNDGRCVTRAAAVPAPHTRAVVRKVTTKATTKAPRTIARVRSAPDANGNLITVSTAAGIDVTLAPSVAGAMQGFIADAVAAGYRPSRIKCFSLSRTHVPGSLHFRGEACDFNQRGWNKTDRFMYRVRAIAAKWGLRDGCSFGDCGHIDSGRIRAAERTSSREPWPRTLEARAVP